MNPRNLIRLLFSLSVLAAMAAACAPRTPDPQQIATYPQSPQGDWFLPAQPAGGSLVYDAYIALEVRDPETASAEAIRIAEDLGGYLVNSHTSTIDGRAAITLELRVPPHNFEAARWSFRSMGDLIRETVTGDWDGGGSGWEPYAQITLFFRRVTPSFSLRGLTDWRPAETLRRALAVSARLLGYLVDVLIWAVVLVGPFALIGWAIAWVVRRGRGSLPSSEGSTPSKKDEDLSEQGENSDE